MDLTLFNSPDFDAKAWINDTLQQQSSSTTSSSTPISSSSSPSHNNNNNIVELQSSTSSAIARLQVLIRDVNTHLDVNCNIAIKKIPSSLIEVDRMTQQALDLHQRIHYLVNQFTLLENSEHYVTEKLQSLHQVKMKLQVVLNTLVQAKHLSKSLENVSLLFKKRQLLNVILPPPQSSTATATTTDAAANTGEEWLTLEDKVDDEIMNSVMASNKMFTVTSPDDSIMFHSDDQSPSDESHHETFASGDHHHHQKNLDTRINISDDPEDLLVREMVNHLYQVKQSLINLEQYGVLNNRQKSDVSKYEHVLLSEYMGPRFTKFLIEKKDIVKAKREMRWARKLGQSYMTSIFQKYLPDRLALNPIIVKMEWGATTTNGRKSTNNLELFLTELNSVVQQESYYYRKIFIEWNAQESSMVDYESNGTEKNMDEKIFSPICSLIEYILQQYYHFHAEKSNVVELVSNQYSTVLDKSQQLLRILNSDPLLSARNHEQIAHIFHTIFKPFNAAQMIYVDKLEKEYLMQQVREVSKPFVINNSKFEDGYQYELEKATKKLFSICLESVDRFTMFTSGIDAQTYVRMINDVIVQFGRYLSQFISDLGKAISKDNSTRQDWSLAQQVLRLYVVVKTTLMIDLSNFEKDLRAKLQNDTKPLIAFTNKKYEKTSHHARNTTNNDYALVNPYILVSVEKNNERVKQALTFLSNLQDGQLSILSLASKNFASILDSIQQLVHKILFQRITNSLRSFNIRSQRESHAPDDEDDSDDEDEHEDIQSFVASEYMSNIEGYLVELVNQLTETVSDDENRYWLDRICRDTVDAVQKVHSQYLRDLASKKPSRRPSEPRKNKHMVEQGILTHHAMKQLLCDLNTLKMVLSMLYHVPSDEQREFFDLVERIFQQDTYKRMQQGFSSANLKYTSALLTTIKELINRAHDYQYIK